MNKHLTLVALVVGARALAFVKEAGSSSEPVTNIAVAGREARACEVLLRKMSSPNADTWNNRMRPWPCIQRAKATRASIEEARR